MMITETTYRVAYSDTDQMGVVYYGNYIKFYEIGRTEMLREAGCAYKKLEEMGIISPVRKVALDYVKPAYYDDLLTIRTIVKELPKVKFEVYGEIYNETGELLSRAKITLAVMDKNTFRPTLPPQEFLDALGRLEQG